MDPPYNTESAHSDGNSVANDKENVNSNKFIYRDKFSRNGWLNMMYERLKIARDLLKNDGFIFVSIDDNEQAYLKVLMDEIFGEENFICNFNFISKLAGRQIKSFVANTHEYILLYAKNINNPNLSLDSLDEEYATKLMPNVYQKRNIQVEKDENGEYILQSNLQNGNKIFNNLTRRNLYYPLYIHLNKKRNKYEVLTEMNCENCVEIKPSKIDNSDLYHVWRWSKNKVEAEKDDLVPVKTKNKWTIFSKKRNLNYMPKSLIMGSSLNTSSANKALESIFNGEVNFNTAKPVDLIKFILKLHFNNNARILDFFAGSGTTGHAVEELNKEDGGNRSYTLVTNNENNIAQNITYERLYRINNGHGTKKEEFDWSKTNEKYKSNLDVFDVKYKSTNLNDSRNIDEIQRNVIKMLNDFGINISLNKLNFEKITNELRSLKKLDK
ncbi:site-specific DNA-methyltransferase [Mycoplasmopsis synoviae]|uniref:site-specific DNA-methyltransferase n=1 Tax=Mycoplasmopsis synoviae TaxID=2109 RepID=UPI001CE1DEA5|nr:site-specific DNA-methyltransferase [Mycoplasmopsis synoviae]